MSLVPAPVGLNWEERKKGGAADLCMKEQEGQATKLDNRGDLRFRVSFHTGQEVIENVESSNQLWRSASDCARALPKCVVLQTLRPLTCVETQ